MNKYPYLKPKAKEAIDKSSKDIPLILTTVDGYITDKEALILRDMLWYAKDNSVEVLFVPKE